MLYGFFKNLLEEKMTSLNYGRLLTLNYLMKVNKSLYIGYNIQKKLIPKDCTF